MFVILRSPDCMESLGTVDAPEIDMAEVYRIYGPEAIVAETLNYGEETLLHPIPPELDRAIDAWNAMVPRIKFHVETIEKRERYVAPYRKWKAKLGKRSYLLEQVVADVETTTDFTKAWLRRFGLLLRVKDGEFTSDLLRKGHYRDPSYRAPEPPPGPVSADDKREFAKQLRAHETLRDIDERHLKNLEEEGY